MRLLFVKECIDKNTQAKYSVGQEVEFPLYRAKEILCTGYAVVIDNEVKETQNEVEETQNETKEEVINTEDFEKMSLLQLKRMAHEKGIDTKKLKNKASIITAILNTIK